MLVIFINEHSNIMQRPEIDVGRHLDAAAVQYAEYNYHYYQIVL